MMKPTEFTPDYAFPDAVFAAWAALASGHAPRESIRPVAQRGQRLPGVYATSRGLYARFSRKVAGRLTYFYVATGVQGDFSKEEEARLHQLWLVASTAWDAGKGR
jgi:hypothetical protein